MSPNAYEPAESNPNKEPVFKISGVMPTGHRAWTYYQGKDEKDALECIQFFAGWKQCRIIPREEPIAVAAAVGTGLCF